MTDTFTTVSARVPAGLEVLEPFVAAGVVAPAELHLAASIVRLTGPRSIEELLALCVAARAARVRHVCVSLADVAAHIGSDLDDDITPLDWPSPNVWITSLAESSLVACPEEAWVEPLRPLVLDGVHLYLHRYWAYEVAVARDLLARASAPQPPTTSRDALREILDRYFGADDPSSPDLQRRAAEVALGSRLAVIAGGPGTGKTRTVARLLAAIHDVAAVEERSVSVALAAPTGKAAARMTEAIHLAVEQATLSPAVDAVLRATEATTIHRLLGSLGGLRFRHDRRNPLPHDVVVIDEMSMVSLPLMARLLDAVRPDARVVLVGDPFQLSSVEAGTVMSDIVGVNRSGPMADRVTVLQRVHRFTDDSGIAELATAVGAGDAAGALRLLSGSRDDLSWVRPDDRGAMGRLLDSVSAAAIEVVRFGRAGEATRALDAASMIKVLCATRHRPQGLYDWSDLIEARVVAEFPDVRRRRRWYPGRPIMVTANDPLTKVSNGDVGLVVPEPDGSGVSVAFPTPGGVRRVPTSRLDSVETWWAMTIHKSQGSEFDHVVVSLPAAGSPILSRELLYTAVTRGRFRVTLVATEEAFREAIAQPVARASGLGARLWGAD